MQDGKGLSVDRATRYSDAGMDEVGRDRAQPLSQPGSLPTPQSRVRAAVSPPLAPIIARK